MTLAERLRELIEAKGDSPYIICANTGEKQSTISRILSGKTKKPQIKTLKSLANYLQTTVEYLKTGDEQKKSIESNIMFTKSGEMENVAKALIETINQKNEEIIRLNKKIVLLEVEIQRLGGSTKNEQSGESPNRELSG